MLDSHENLVSDHSALDDPAVMDGINDMVSHPEQMLERLDETLDLIAEANSVASGVQQVKGYDISLIVPVYNEVNSLPQVVDRILEVMPPATEIILVDDASDDGTTDWLRTMPTRNNVRVLFRRRNHGKGSAIRMAIRHSRGRVVAIQDADLEYDPANLLRVVWPVLEGRADAVYGSRYLTANNQDGLLHRIGNGVLTKASNSFTGLKLTDMETCHKAFRGDLLRSIPLQECRFGFEPEITAKIASRGAKVIEVSTGYQARSYDEGKKIGWRDAASALRCMWSYRKG